MRYLCTPIRDPGADSGIAPGTYMFGIAGAAYFVGRMLEFDGHVGVRVEGPGWTVIVKRKAKK